LDDPQTASKCARMRSLQISIEEAVRGTEIEGKNIIYTLDTRLSSMEYGVNFKLIGDDAGHVRQRSLIALVKLEVEISATRLMVLFEVGVPASSWRWIG
jgi:hypothetical protein